MFYCVNIVTYWQALRLLMMISKSKILVILFVSVFLISCSKKEGSIFEDSNATYQAEGTTIVDEQNNTSTIQPLVQQRPEVLLMPHINEIEQRHQMVREANIQFTTQDTIKTALAIDKMTIDFGGYVEQKNINFQIIDVKVQKVADGKIKIFEKINPVADIIVRIPNEKAANFVNDLLPLMHFLNQQLYSAKRYELKLLEGEVNEAQNKNEKVNNISHLSQLEIRDRACYSTIIININQPVIVRERTDIDIDTIAHLNTDGFWIRAWRGIQCGWIVTLDFIVILIAIWPLYLLIIIGVLVYYFIKSILEKYK